MQPLVSIIIVNWNGKCHLQPCLSSIFASNYPRDKMEIIVSDNGSTDGSLEYLKESWPQVKIIENKSNLGFPEGNNRGFAQAQGEVLLLLNNDTAIDREFIGELVSALGRSPKLGAAGAKIMAWNDSNPAFKKNNQIVVSWPKMDPWTALGFNFCDERPQASVDYLSGAAMAVKKSVFDEVGGMDAEYFAYFEETDWCARIIRAGYDCAYMPTAVVWHRVESSAQEHSSDFHDYRMVRNRIRFVLKNFDAKNLAFFIAYYPFELLAKLGLLAINSAILAFKILAKKPGTDESRQIISFYLGELRFAPKAVFWNFSNLAKTISMRKESFSRIKNPRSYNDNLPLKNVQPNLRVLR